MLKVPDNNDIVISSYASILAITDKPKEVVENLKRLEKYNMQDKYGFFESIDFTPARLKRNEKFKVVKTYMAHHQALSLLSINNLINNNILLSAKIVDWTAYEKLKKYAKIDENK